MPDLAWLEAFALSDDRASLLEQLIPGTEDHYHYSALVLEQAGEPVDAVLSAWVARHGETERVRQMRDRVALASFGAPASLEHLRRRLDPTLDHQQQLEGQATSHPCRLDPSDVATLLWRDALQRPGLERFTDHALGRLLTEDLDAERRRALLARLTRPDHEGLVDVVLADLDHPESGDFGSLAIHGLLLLDQLRALATARPQLLGQPAFVAAWLQRLRPAPDDDVELDPDARQAWLDRLWAFAEPLPPVHNGLKALVLHHLLRLDQRRGRVHLGRLAAYLALPRQAEWAEPERLKRIHRQERADHPGPYPGSTGLDPISDDDALVRDLLGQHLQHSDDLSPFAPSVRADWLQRRLATARILAGDPDLERWTSLLDDPVAFQALRERVDIDLAPTNPERWPDGEPVVLDVHVKNVGTLVVKVFEVNSLAVLRATGRRVDTDLDLDGLVPSRQHTLQLEAAPLLRVRHSLPIEELDRPGLYVVELIGGGISSRALVRRGRLQLLERHGAAGHLLTIVDGDHTPVPGARLWLGDRALTADASGIVGLPFTTRPETTTVVLSQGAVASLAQLRHLDERYTLDSGFLLEPETLVRGSLARLVVRPQLRLHGEPVAIARLEDVTLTLTTTDRHGVHSSRVDPLTLREGADLTVTMPVPSDLVRLELALRGRVRRNSTDSWVDVSAETDVELNGIDATEQVHDLHLSRTDQCVVLRLLDKTGGSRAGVPVRVELGHRDVTEVARQLLQTDDRGRIELGDLTGFTTVAATCEGAATRRWRLPTPGARLPRTVHTRAGQPVRLPWPGGRVSVLERRGDGFLRDCAEHTHAHDGGVEVRDLTAGDYSVWLSAIETELVLRVSDGVEVGGHLLGPRRLLPPSPPCCLQIRGIDAGEQGVTVRLAGTTAATRVHVLGTTFVPRRPGADLAVPTAPDHAPEAVTTMPSRYVSGRDIGDEYRYILERRTAPRFPGVLLSRPGLLLNPFALRETSTDTLTAAEGAAWAASAAPPPGARRSRAKRKSGRRAAVSHTPSVDFLQEPARVWADLRPDADGTISLPSDALSGVQELHVVAVDTAQTVWSSRALPEVEPAVRDLRLERGLDPDTPVVERTCATAVPAGEALVLADVTTSKIQPYGTLGRVFSLLQTLSDHEHLRTFSFVLQWPDLSDEERRERYSERACHELNLFLSRKDPAFFASVVQPWLRHKRHKTFLDHYLLEHDLSPWLEPWRHGRLNIVERILLGRRVAGQHGPARRHTESLVDLLDRDPHHDDQLFRTALQGGALQASELPELELARADEIGRSALAGGGGPPAPAQAAMAASEPEPMEEEADEDDGEAYGRAERRLSEQERPLYRDLPTTRELAETDYYRLPIEQQGPDLVTANAFWRDFARHVDGSGPFVSPHVAEASGSFTEMMLALAVLDLPFTAQPPRTEASGARVSLVADTPWVAFHEEILPAELVPGPVLVSQTLLRSDDRTRREGGTQVDKPVTGELLVNVAYVCRVVLTNPTSSAQELQVLLQIPVGSVPLAGGFETRGVRVRLPPHGTGAVEVGFTFPQPGTFPHFGAHVARDEVLIAAVEGRTWTVVRTLSQADEASWPWIAHHADDDAVLAYLDSHLIEELPLGEIAWRMRDRGFYDRTLALLADRRVYDPTLWAYSLHHGDPDGVATFLLHEQWLLDTAGLQHPGPLPLLDPVTRHRTQHLEYAPLVNARAHRLGEGLRILNDRFAAQYERCLTQLSQRPTLDADDWLAVATYQLLQDRISEGLASLARVDPDGTDSHLQLAYLRAYAAFYTDPEAARELAEPHRDHPIQRWRTLFRRVLQVLDGSDDAAMDPDDRDQVHEQLAASTPALELELVDGHPTVQHRHLDRCTVSIYEMDIELLFSRQPFVQQDAGRFSWVAANHVEELSLAGDATRVPLPERYRSANVVIEVAGGGQTRSLAHYAHRLSVRFAGAYGRLQVSLADSGKPASTVYVKVYARTHDGQVTFYKDGYTDLRGWFDYSSLSTDTLSRVERFAVLVHSDTDGSLIREAAPPR